MKVVSMVKISGIKIPKFSKNLEISKFLIAVRKIQRNKITKSKRFPDQNPGFPGYKSQALKNPR